jgi:hypothetical protein
MLGLTISLLALLALGLFIRQRSARVKSMVVTGAAPTTADKMVVQSGTIIVAIGMLAWGVRLFSWVVTETSSGEAGLAIFVGIVVAIGAMTIWSEHRRKVRLRAREGARASPGETFGGALVWAAVGVSVWMWYSSGWHFRDWFFLHKPADVPGRVESRGAASKTPSVVPEIAAPLLDLSLADFVSRANRAFADQKLPALSPEPAFVTETDTVFTRTFRWKGPKGHVRFIIVQDKSLLRVRDVTLTWGRENDIQSLEGLLTFGVLTMAVEPEMSAKQRGELANALLATGDVGEHSVDRGKLRYTCTMVPFNSCSVGAR